jgi:hypothetical protein
VEQDPGGRPRTLHGLLENRKAFAPRGLESHPLRHVLSTRDVSAAHVEPPITPLATTAVPPGVRGPFASLAGQKDLKVVMLVSENPGADMATPLADAKAADTFFAMRDPSGGLRARLHAMGLLADGSVSVTDEQELLVAVLKAQGNPVSLDVMPGSTHIYLSDAGLRVFLLAFEKAAAPG